MNNLNRIHLAGLRTVEAIGRLGTLRAAANELGVTPGAVSQQVQKTERQLGHALFLRRRTGMSLTARGEQVMRHLSTGMSELSAAVAMAVRVREEVLTVSAAPVFTGKWLVWRLTKFNSAHPDIRVHVDATEQIVDPDLSDVDVCIRVGDDKWSGANATKLLDQWVFPVCSPAIAERIGSAKDLSGIPIIRDSGAMFGWNVWLEPEGLAESILNDGPVFSNSSLCVDAAIAGQGVFLAWETIAGDAIERGQLVAPLSGRYPNGLAFWLVVGNQAAKSRKLRTFATWLHREMNSPLDSPQPQ